MIPINFERRIELLTLRNQGWSYNEIARKFEISPTSVIRMHKRIKNLSIEDLQKMQLEENCPLQ